jgi:hypothetical protein
MANTIDDTIATPMNQTTSPTTSATQLRANALHDQENAWPMSTVETGAGWYGRAAGGG